MLVYGTDLSGLYSSEVQGSLVADASLSSPNVLHSFDGQKNFLLMTQAYDTHVF